eukprot:587146-Rhodomonas_salina.2
MPACGEEGARCADGWVEVGRERGEGSIDAEMERWSEWRDGDRWRGKVERKWREWKRRRKRTGEVLEDDEGLPSHLASLERHHIQHRAELRAQHVQFSASREESRGRWVGSSGRGMREGSREENEGEGRE